MPEVTQGETTGVIGWAVWAQSAVNALLGDYLHAEANGLAIEMGFYSGGRRLRLDRTELAALALAPAPRLCVLVHGLGCSESVWTWRAGADGPLVSYGTLLHDELGYTALALRYNTGLPVAQNGHRLCALLDELTANYPVPLEEILLIGHSMGGLLLRHACHAATHGQHRWLHHVRRVFYLGTPHEGADLERLTHAAAATLHAVPNPITRLVGQVLNLRSHGVRDLRHGAVYDTPSGEGQSLAAPLPWLPTAQHYLIAGTVASSPNHLASALLGDGLVRAPASAPRDGTHVRIFPGVHHLGLARSHAVYAQIRTWCAEDPPAPEESDAG